MPRSGPWFGIASACLLAVACGNGGGGGLAVKSTVVKSDTTQDVQLMWPEADGRWPVVIALHGLRGTGSDMVELGNRVAAAGAVVFAPSYNTDVSSADGLARTSDDVSCAYQLARSTAAAHGGDLTKPVIAVGWSLGADLIVMGSLQASDQNGSARCPGELPRPQIVVGVSGCYYEFEGSPVNWYDDVNNWGNKSAAVYLVHGDADTVCPSWQTLKLADSLRAVGYDVHVVELHHANHFAPVFHDIRDGKWEVIADDPAGDQLVETIVAAMRGPSA